VLESLPRPLLRLLVDVALVHLIKIGAGGQPKARIPFMSPSRKCVRFSGVPEVPSLTATIGRG